MFGNISQKFQTIFSSLTSKKVLTEESIADAVRQVRLALLDADVNYAVAKRLIQRIKEKTVGKDKIKAEKAIATYRKLINEVLDND